MKSPESFEALKLSKSKETPFADGKSKEVEELGLKELEDVIAEVEQKRDALKQVIEQGDKEAETIAIEELNKSLRKARIIRRKIEGRSTLESISTTYTIKDEKGKEKSETIEIDFEKKLEYTISFYKKHGIEIPEDFTEIMSDIWQRNTKEMEKAIEEQGFDDILLIPEGLSVPDLHSKMKEGYAETYKGSYFTDGGSFEGVTENTREPRIILIHKDNAQNLKNRPELSKTLGKKAKDLVKAGEKLTLTDYLIFQRQYFEETGKHLDEDGWTWLPGSTVKNPSGGGVRFVYAGWGSVGLGVYAFDPSHSHPHLGCRLSRCFT